ncbi:1,5-anhydro-D-fructose reductase [Streptomyces sp. YIM 121038]|uniref:Gfo/Idh/MocA family protein n=1 Tax=Streptomyces sp. YIM 121038 TaxID=2136401 RepID=UPI0011108892|nr:Gfo/Idh/MocA family oxidoreductase [Streptomyces sp. YIM 121038]QCX80769.1 1,5-anhydro-D-fructose reductase [Streptomyces sp. YIM 121038]
MRGAIIGFGTIAMGHMVGYSRVQDLSIAAVVDVSKERRSHAEESFGLPAYSDFAKLVANETLDFIDICTPPSSHAEYSALGLAHGLHVLCEKPVFLPDEDGYAGQLGRIRASDRVYYPCHVYKYAPVLAAMKERIAAPGFGKVVGAHFRTLRAGHAKGVPDWRPHWRREPGTSHGGILRDHGPHSVYLAMNLTGLTPMSVSCLTGRLREGAAYADTEDTALMRLRCEGGVEIALHLSWAAGHRSTGYSIMGTSGSVVVDGDDLTYAADGDVVRTSIESGFDDPSHQEWFERMLLDFTAVVAAPERGRDLIREALTTSFVIDGAYASAADGGRWVDCRVPEALLNPA